LTAQAAASPAWRASGGETMNVRAMRTARRPAVIMVGRGQRRKVLVASSLGTAFEWYDFFVYATLAPFFASLFFPAGNESAALLAAFATYAAGFLARPFGALFFGRIGDVMGRKYAFMATLLVMGTSTFAVGLLPTYEDIGWAATLMLVAFRLAQGFALGGEYGGAATYVAEHVTTQERGYATSWIQMSVSGGFLLSLIVIMACRQSMDLSEFKDWGWRVPFLASIVLLIVSAYIRMQLQESPVFEHMREQQGTSDRPLGEALFKYPNNARIFIALFGAKAGQAVIWYTGQFYALFFMLITLRADYEDIYPLMMLALVIGAPFFIMFGALSDRLGRKAVIMLGAALSLLTLFPIYHALTKAVNPELHEFQKRVSIVLSVDPGTCNFHLFAGPWSNFSDCDRAKDYLTKMGLSFTTASRPGAPPGVTVGDLPELPLSDWSAAGRQENLLLALIVNGYPLKADPEKMNRPMIVALLVTLMAFVAMTFGPIAALLTELFPTRVRYTSVAFTDGVGGGFFGGVLPLMATAMVAWAGDIYFGLWFTFAITTMTLILGTLFLPNATQRDLKHS
jgi:MFS family permease